jgi:hypothetical protein
VVGPAEVQLGPAPVEQPRAEPGDDQAKDHVDAPGQSDVGFVVVLRNPNARFFDAFVVVDGVLTHDRTGGLIGVLSHADLLADVFTMEMSSGRKKT